MAEPQEPLTERELEIVRLLGTGAGNKEIAAQLYLSPNTVKVHLRNIFTKLEAKSRTEVTMIAVRNGWIMLDQAHAADIAAQSTVPAEASASVAEPPVSVTHSDNGTPSLSNATEAPASTTAHAQRVGVTSPMQVGPVSAAVSAERGTPPAANEAAPNLSAPAVSAPIAAPITVVPVAPNPQPLPRLALWQRLALVGAALAALLTVVLAVPAPRSTASGGFDPLRIGPAQPRSTFLMRGESSRWYLRAPLPVARARSAAVAVGSNIYIIGGEVDQMVSGDVLLYHPIRNTWQTMSASKPTPVANAMAAVVDQRIYMVGGTTSDGRATDRVEVFDTTTRRWQSLSPFPTPIAGHALAAFGKQLFVFGGMSALGPTSTSYRYDIARDKWEPVSPLPTRRSLAAAATLNGHIYVVGGYDNGRELATCESYEPSTDAWSACAPMTIPRSGLGLARISNNLFAIGGGVSGFIGFNERYDTASNRWTAIETPLTSDWQSPAIAARDTEFYVFGGYSGGERLAFTYVYEVFSNRVFVPAFQSPGSYDKPKP